MKNRLSLLAVPIICALTVASLPASASANTSTLFGANHAAGESKAQVVQEDDWDYGDTWDEEEMLPEVEVSRGSGIETEGEEVELIASPNTKIYYTTDGSVPTISSTVYSKPIVLSGKVDLRYMAVDESGNKSEIGEEVYYTYSIDSTLENEEVMTGSGVPGMKISVMKEDKSIGQTVVDKNGKFKVRFERQKVDTVLTVVEEIDGYMNNRSQIQVWDDTPPILTVPLEMTDDVLILKGRSEAGATISIRGMGEEGNHLGEGIVKSDGTFAVSFKRPDGNKISVTAIDQNGTRTEVIVTLKDVTAPVISFISPIYDNHQMFYVIAEGGNSLIEVFKNGKRIAFIKTSAPIDQDAYYFTIEKQKAGTVLSITITDPLGNKSKPYQAIVKDATPPAVPKVAAFSDVMTKLTGTAENQSTVVVMNGTKKVGQATTTSGKFSVKLAKQKAGTELIIYAMDRAKNKSKNVRLKVLDKTAPLTPTSSPVTTKSVSLNGKTEANANVYLYRGKTKIANTKSNSKGFYKLTFKPQVSGTTLSLYVIDVAKNKSKTKSIKVSVFKKSNATYLKEHFAASKKGTMYKAEAKLYDRMTIKGKDAIYGLDSTSCCVFGKVKSSLVYGTIGFDEKYPNHIGDIMTMPSFDNRKIKWTEMTSALGKPKVHRKYGSKEWNKMLYAVNDKIIMKYERAGTLEYKPTKKTTFWADYDGKGYIRAFGLRHF